jgi:hypothetical protein
MIKSKKILAIGGLMIVVVLMAVTGFVVFKQPDTQPLDLQNGETTNFNFIFRYGVGAKNELDTFSRTYTKDMVMGASITINFELTNDELVGIYQKIKDLKLFEKSEESAERNMIVNPCSSYSLKVQIDSTQEKLSWDNCQGSISDKFQQFTNYIIKIIESKEEYKKLPTPRGGYL